MIAHKRSGVLYICTGMHVSTDTCMSSFDKEKTYERCIIQTHNKQVSQTLKLTKTSEVTNYMLHLVYVSVHIQHMYMTTTKFTLFPNYNILKRLQ